MPVEPRWRTGVGMALILGWIAAWSIAAVSIGALIADVPIALLLTYYGLAGLAWILPLRPLIRWMHTGRWRRD